MKRVELQNVLRAILSASLRTALASGSMVLACGCSCPEAVLVVPLGDASVPSGVAGFASDRTLSEDECTMLCGRVTSGCHVVMACASRDDCGVSTNGSSGTNPLAVECDVSTMCIGGRRPLGLCSSGARGDESDSVGLHFAELARLESASIDAFEILADELRAHRAPECLVHGSQRAARDEIRHARIAGRLAHRYGSMRRDHQVKRQPVRSLVEIASENAAEGLVRETFGALVTSWQACAASDPSVRRSLSRVASDEARHAALSLEVNKWADGLLSPAERETVRDARREAIRTLELEALHEPSARLVEVAGLPNAAHAQRMLSTLKQTLWA